jgi:hypothetical protein
MMHKLISKRTGLIAVFATLVMTPMVIQSAIAQQVPTQGTETAMSGCDKAAGQTTGETVKNDEVAHAGHVHRRRKDKPASEDSSAVMPIPTQEQV